jgi:hypothetical protein
MHASLYLSRRRRMTVAGATGMRWREGTLKRFRAISLVSESETETRVKTKRFDGHQNRNPKIRSDDHDDDKNGSIGQRAYKYKDPSDSGIILVSNSVYTEYADAWCPRSFQPMLLIALEERIHHFFF